MGHASLQKHLDDLEASGQLLRIEQEIDPYLEAAAIHRRVYAAGGPALLFARVKGCQFPMVSNLFGTLERARYLFRDTLESVRRLIELKIDASAIWQKPTRYLGAPRAALTMLPKQVRSGPVLAHRTTIGALPRLHCWPNDGGSFITLPQVYTEDPNRPGWQHSNLGMYRVQLSGGQYAPDQEVGLHYQIHRSIGVHHTSALRQGEPLRASVFVGGPPAMTLAAVMPLPEGLSELTFAGALAGRRIRLVRRPDESAIHADADFCLTGTIVDGKQLPEGPFGDHLGYYAKVHDFPVLRVDHVYHRRDAVWPFTVVGRPPQEDTVFGQLIHELTGPVIPTVLPGVQAVHAVDAAGVHPLLLAIGSERYVPDAVTRRPMELLTQANAILGQGQLSLAKYLWIANHADAPSLDIHDVSAFLQHMLARVDWSRDLHFQTCTTIDTLDYSGSALNEGSKLVVAATGPTKRQLAADLPKRLELPSGWREPTVAFPGALVVAAPPSDIANGDLEQAVANISLDHPLNQFPLVVVVDDAQFTAKNLANFLWVTFTRSNPAADVYGVAASWEHKHWGCHGALVIDARSKPHHAPPLLEDPSINRRVDALAARGGPLHGIV